MADVLDELPVLTSQITLQAVNAFLIGVGMGGMPGASTLGVAMFPVIAPDGYVKQFLAVVPVICLCSSSSTVIFNHGGAVWSKVKQMAIPLLIGIGLGTLSLPLFNDTMLKRTIALTYALLLAQRFYEQYQTFKATRAKKNDDKSVKFDVEASYAWYNSDVVAWSAALFCGWITVVANSSGPIFNIYLLACGYNMDQFVGTRAVFMATNNFCTVVSRFMSGSLNVTLILHGVKIGMCCVVGVLAGKPIKKRLSPAWYEYLTYFSLSSSIYKLVSSSL
eukprot:TRINITY_DN73474_c0_g1_i1.p1 TRINITY_DN73474_c0_g1~~TRINITY_DN73474_c0_g1_i1.p1  ORF type:complete len:302 (+),score=26.24 TRINITY_DN73474_c0_g1_i1:78-908(+)